LLRLGAGRIGFGWWWYQGIAFRSFCRRFGSREIRLGAGRTGFVGGGGTRALLFAISVAPSGLRVRET